MYAQSAYALTAGSAKRLALRAVLGLTGKDPDSRSTWIHLADCGEWRGHPSGAFTLTQEDFACIIEDWKRKATPVSMDYEHASLVPSGEPTPASGYVRDLAVRGQGLWAYCELTTRAAALVRAGEYRFCSAVFNFGAADGQSGERVACVLDSIALTNRPFLDGQTPIALSRSTKPHAGNRRRILSKMKITKEELLAALDKLGAEAFDPAQLTKLIEALKAMAEASAPEEAEAAEDEAPEAEVAASRTTALSMEDPAATPAPAPGAEQPAADVMESIASALGTDDAGVREALAANLEAVIALLKGEAQAPEAVATLTATLTKSLAAARVALSKHENEERARTERALNAEVDCLVAAGKLHPAQLADVRKLAVKHPAQFRALAAALVPVYPLAAHATALTPPTPTSAVLGEVVIDEKDPRVIALNKALDGAGMKDSAKRTAAIRAALNKVSAGGH